MKISTIQPVHPIGLQKTNAFAKAMNDDASLKVEARSDEKEVREAFDTFVGQTFYSHMLKSMRNTVGKPAYFHGGRAEEVFQSQLDQLMVEEMTKASANQFSDPMFELFQLSRR